MKNIDKIQHADIEELADIICFELHSKMQHCEIVDWLEQESEK